MVISMVNCCHVVVKLWSCGGHVVVNGHINGQLLSCGGHVVVMMWSCSGHVNGQW